MRHLLASVYHARSYFFSFCGGPFLQFPKQKEIHTTVVFVTVIYYSEIMVNTGGSSTIDTAYTISDHILQPWRH